MAFLNDSKQQICVLGCNLCDSEEKRSLFHNQNNEWACNHENQSANHPRQQDQNSKSDRLNKQINELTERESYKIKWVEKRNEYESEIKELRRAKEKATQKNIKYEEQVTYKGSRSMMALKTFYYFNIFSQTCFRMYHQKAPFEKFLTFVVVSLMYS